MAAALGTLSSGAVNGWSAGTLTSLDADPDITMGTAETAWVASIISVGSLAGSVVAGRVMDKLGRRTTLLAMAPVLLLGWLTMALAPNIAGVLTGRAICGVATAFLFSTGPVYCSEIPEARMRGRLGSVPSLFITFGVVLSYLAGACFSWRVSCYVCCVPVVLMFVAMVFATETPYWLLLKGRREDAEKVLRRLRGPEYNFDVEIEEMEKKMTSVGKKMEYRELWRPRTRRPFLISLFMMTLQQVSGGNVLMMYTGTIFMSAGVENHSLATVYTGIVQIVFTVLCVLLVDRLGRRPFIVLSTSVMGLATIMLGVYYFMNDVVGLPWPSWVPLVTVLVAVSGYCLGCRTLPWLLSAELFNTTIRSTANSASLFYNRLLNLAVIQVFPFFAEAAGSHTVFFVHGSLSLICAGLSLLLVPETKGKSLEQIQEYFESQAAKKSAHKAEKSSPNGEAAGAGQGNKAFQDV